MASMEAWVLVLSGPEGLLGAQMVLSGLLVLWPVCAPVRTVPTFMGAQIWSVKPRQEAFCHRLLSISVYICLTPSCCLTTHFKWSIGLQLLPEGPLTSKQTKSQHTAYLPTRTSCTSPPINWTESNWIPLQAHLGHTNPFRKTTPIQDYITISILIFDNFVYGFMS